MKHAEWPLSLHALTPSARSMWEPGKLRKTANPVNVVYALRELRKDVVDFFLEAKDCLFEVAESLANIGFAAAMIMRKPKLGVTIGAIGLFGASQEARACLRPPGSDDAPYIAAGLELQTNLLSFKILVPGVGTGQRNTSATLWNGENAITAAHNVADLLQFNPTYEVATGPNYMTNRGTVIAIDHVAINTNLDIAVLHLASCLSNVKVTVAESRPGVGEVLTLGGFGSFGTPGGTPTKDGNGRAWQAPLDARTYGDLPPELYFSTDFGGNNVPLNGQGLSGDSGGITLNARGELVGIIKSGALGLPLIGNTQSLDVTRSNAAVYNFIVQNLITSQPSLLLSSGSTGPTVYISGKANQVYTLQRSYDLSNWAGVGTFTNQTGVVSWPDPDAASHGAGFYRAVVQ